MLACPIFTTGSFSIAEAEAFGRLTSSCGNSKGEGIVKKMNKGAPLGGAGALVVGVVWEGASAVPFGDPLVVVVVPVVAPFGAGAAAALLGVGTLV